MKGKSTKTALLMSFTSLLLCAAMLIGTTFAWFTDSVTSGVNKIVAGNLDVDVEYAVPGENGVLGNFQKMDSNTTSLFSSNLWEPGHTEYVTLKVVNKGTLALNYKLNVSPVSESGGINMAGQNFKLSDYLVFSTTAANKDLTTYATREAARSAAGTGLKLNQGGLSKGGVLYPQDDSTGPNAQYITLVVYMPESVGNEANYKKGTEAPFINLGVTVVATQKDHEIDSFGPDYDGGADLTPDNAGKDAVVYDYFPQVAQEAQITISATGEVTASGASLASKGEETATLTVESDAKIGTGESASSAAKVSVDVKTSGLTEEQKDKTGSLTLKVVKDDVANANFQAKAESPIDTTKQDSTTYQVTVETEGVVPMVSETPKYTVDMFIGKNLKNVVMYHDVGGAGTNVVTMTDNYADRAALVAAGVVDSFFYDKNTGYVTMVVDKFSPFTSVYDKAVAVIGTTRYYSLESAVEAAKTGETITMIQDVALQARIDVAKKIALDLNGKTISAATGFEPANSGVFGVKRGGDLTVNDSAGNGKIASDGVYAAIAVTIKGESETGATAKLTVNGGTLKGLYYGVVTNGSRHDTDITVNGGTLTGFDADDSAAIYHPNKGKLTINGGTLTGYDAVAVKGGTPVTITGGEFIATGTKVEPTEPATSGCNSVGSALYVEGNYGYGAGVIISGGTFKTTDSTAPAVLSLFNEETQATISITGGTYSSDPTAYVAEGYEAKQTGDLYTVSLIPPKEYGVKNEEELNEALLRVKNGDVIKVLESFDITKAQTKAAAAQKFTIDLNGKTITSNKTFAIKSEIREYMTYEEYLDLGWDTPTKEEYDADPYLRGTKNKPVEVTVKNGNYVIDGTDSGRIRFEKGSTGHFENVNFSTSNDEWYQALQTYATNQTGENEVNTYTFDNCSFTNCFTSFEGGSGSCNKYDIRFTNCGFTAVNMGNGAACIKNNYYVYGTIKVEGTTFNINSTNTTSYCVKIENYLSNTNGQKVDVNLNGVTMNTSGNVYPYSYNYMIYNSNCVENAVITETGKNTFTHNGKTVEMVIKETSATNKSVAWTENADAYKACLAEWVAYANAKPSDYGQYKYYLVECNGYYFIGGQGSQFNDNATVTKEDTTVTQVVVGSGYSATTYKNIGTTDISTQLGEDDNLNVHIYTLATK